MATTEQYDAVMLRSTVTLMDQLIDIFLKKDMREGHEILT